LCRNWTGLVRDFPFFTTQEGGFKSSKMKIVTIFMNPKNNLIQLKINIIKIRKVIEFLQAEYEMEIDATVG
jgi:hypothetical protein